MSIFRISTMALIATAAAILSLLSPSRCSAQAPRVCYVSSGGGASIVIGSGFDSSTVVVMSTAADIPKSAATGGAAAYLPSAPPELPPPGAKTITPTAIQSNQALDVTLPNLAAVIWVKNASGISSPRLINQPEIWLVNNERPVPGDQLRLFGRNLRSEATYAMDTFGSAVMFRNRTTGKITIIPVRPISDENWGHADDHMLGVTVALNLAPGPYDLLAYAGNGGEHGWSVPFKIMLRARRSTLAEAYVHQDEPSPGIPAHAVRVKGAVGDGITDDTAAVQSALDVAAAAGGGIVTLPAGQYAISRTLHIHPGVFLHGTGANSTSIVVTPMKPLSGGLPNVSLTPSLSWQRGYADDWKKYVVDGTPMIWIETKSGISDLTLIGGPGAKCAVFVATKDWHAISENVSIIRTNITTNERTFEVAGYQPYVFGVSVMTATRNFTLTQCRFKCGEPIYLYPARPQHYSAAISNNTFEVFPRQSTGNVCLQSITHSLIEDNDFIGGARSLESQRGTNHNWIFNNRITDDGGRGNADEMMMSEYGQNFWDGSCQSASANTIQAQGADWPNGHFLECSDPIYVFIKQGTGFGQIRQVTANTSDTLTVDSPWDILPDSTTQFTVLNMTYRNLYVNDQTVECGGLCLLGYGAFSGCVVSGLNSRESGGFEVTSLWHPEQPGFAGGVVAFNDFSWNRLIGLGSITLHDVGFHHGQDDADITRRGNVIGNTVRDNEILNFRSYPLNQYNDVWRRFKSSRDAAITVGGGAFNVVSDNYIASGSVGIRIDAGEGNAVTGNRIDNVAAPIFDKGKNTLIVIPPSK